MESKTKDEVAVAGRVEIDTSAPFQSVKEAVMLFGERNLAGEICATKHHNQVERTENKKDCGKLGSAATELEETRQNLDIARQESLSREHLLISVKQELDRTRRELQELKEKESEGEDVKFVEDTTEFQRRRSVRFADIPQLGAPTFERRQSSLNAEATSNRKKSKKLKKMAIHFIGGLCSPRRADRVELNSFPM